MHESWKQMHQSIKRFLSLAKRSTAIDIFLKKWRGQSEVLPDKPFNPNPDTKHMKCASDLKTIIPISY